MAFVPPAIPRVLPVHPTSPASHSTPPTSPGDTSFKVFRRFIAKSAQGLDASLVVSLGCYKEWLATRHGDVNEPQKSFQRSLTAHVTKSDGRRSFLPDEEAAILFIIRQKKIWPAFAGTDCRIGLLGFRAVGFNERFSTSGQDGSAFQAQLSPSSKNLKRTVSKGAMAECASPHTKNIKMTTTLDWSYADVGSTASQFLDNMYASPILDVCVDERPTSPLSDDFPF